MRLQGQNLRILTYNSVSEKYRVVAMATSCQATLTNNTEDESTKDDVDLSSRPRTASKGWSVQADALNILDAPALLTAIKSREPMKLMFDETSTDDNVTPEAASYSRSGLAYMNDVSLTFNDRETAAKTLQWTGTGPLTHETGVEAEDSTPGAYTKGQFVRLFLGSDNTATPSKVIAAAKQLTLHVSVSLEDATTKDTTGEWLIQEPVGLSYDISTNALVRGADDITSSVDGQGLSELEDIYEAGTPVKWQIAKVSGANQRTKGDIIASGSAVLTQLQFSAQNRAAATYDATLNGYGPYTAGA
jgi:predicted secreted protein